MLPYSETHNLHHVGASWLTYGAPSSPTNGLDAALTINHLDVMVKWLGLELSLILTIADGC